MLIEKCIRKIQFIHFVVVFLTDAPAYLRAQAASVGRLINLLIFLETKNTFCSVIVSFNSKSTFLCYSDVRIS